MTEPRNHKVPLQLNIPPEMKREFRMFAAERDIDLSTLFAEMFEFCTRPGLSETLPNLAHAVAKVMEEEGKGWQRAHPELLAAYRAALKTMRRPKKREQYSD